MIVRCKKVLIRYNTESDGKALQWRLLLDGSEQLANTIAIEKPCHTSTDWLEDKQCFKHHISVNECEVHIDDALIQTHDIKTTNGVIHSLDTVLTG